MSYTIRPAELAEIIDTHRDLFGGWTMMADETVDGTSDKGDANTPGDKLGEGGYKALVAEREARKDLEKQLKELAPLKDQMAALAAAFGTKPDETPDMAGQIADMRRELDDAKAAREREALVEEVVTAHEGLSAADASLIRKMPDKQSMTDLAKRLTATQAPNRKGDPSAGRGGTGDNGGRSASVAAAMEARLEAAQKKNKN